jgi:transcriptional regulator with XRE-family HTH domain
MDIREQIAANLRYARKRAGLSQEEVGVRASIHRTEISMLERAIRLPRSDTLVKLAGALGVEPGELLDGIAWEPGEMRPGSFKPSAGEA